VAPSDDVDVERPAPGIAIATFTGEHDLATQNKIEDLLTGLVSENKHVVVDFSRAQFVDSSVLHVIRRVDEDAEDRGCAFRVQLATAAIVRRAFEITGLLDTFDIASTREAALEPRQ
jgi:anti-sigma B factor antagonist